MTILDESYRYTGFATNYKAERWNAPEHAGDPKFRIDSQTFSTSYGGYGTPYSVDDYEALFMQYYNSVVVEPQQNYDNAVAALANAQATQNTAQTELDNANTTLTLSLIHI